MILKEMLKLCKKSKRIRFIETENDIFVSDEYVMANVTEIAQNWTAEDYATALDLTQDERDNYRIKNTKIDADLCNEITEEAERMRFSLNIDGEAVQPFILADGRVLFIQCKYHSIFKEEHPKEYRLGKFEDCVMLYIYVGSRMIGGICPLRIDGGCVKEFARDLLIGAEKAEKEGFLQGYTQYSLIDD